MPSHPDDIWSQAARLTSPAERIRASVSAYYRRLPGPTRTLLLSVIDSGDPARGAEGASPGAALAEQGDVAGARAAYQRAIDTGHPEWARWRWSTWGCCSPSRVMSRGLGPPTSGPSTPATPSRARRRSAWGCCWPSRVMWRGLGPPTSGSSTPATPSGRRGRWSAWGCCSISRVMWRGLGPPTSGPSTPTTPTRH